MKKIFLVILLFFVALCTIIGNDCCVDAQNSREIESRLYRMDYYNAIRETSADYYLEIDSRPINSNTIGKLYLCTIPGQCTSYYVGAGVDITKNTSSEAWQVTFSDTTSYSLGVSGSTEMTLKAGENEVALNSTISYARSKSSTKSYSVSIRKERAANTTYSVAYQVYSGPVIYIVENQSHKQLSKAYYGHANDVYTSLTIVEKDRLSKPGYGKLVPSDPTKTKPSVTDPSASSSSSSTTSSSSSSTHYYPTC